MKRSDALLEKLTSKRGNETKGTKGEGRGRQLELKSDPKAKEARPRRYGKGVAELHNWRPPARSSRGHAVASPRIAGSNRGTGRDTRRLARALHESGGDSDDGLVGGLQRSRDAAGHVTGIFGGAQSLLRSRQVKSPKRPATPSECDSSFGARIRKLGERGNGRILGRHVEERNRHNNIGPLSPPQLAALHDGLWDLMGLQLPRW